MHVPRILFLPGAGGDPAFWRPVANQLPAHWQKTLLGWPGLGQQPASPDVNGWNDLYRLVEQHIDGPVAIVAQSMGGVLAMRAALAHRESVSHLVLTATSGGIDLTPFAVEDWRDDYRRVFPDAPSWVYDPQPRNDEALASLAIPTLLIWAARDSISPPAIGRHLARLLPNAEIVELNEDSHLFARERPAAVAPLIEAHLAKA